ncbi:MAG: Dabb family protein [Clostridia bacterium]|nr:Dabb family protein [Clostridia bacterium]
MIKHIVCFKLKEGESVDKAVEVLKSMEGKVPSALKIEVGKDFLHSARSYDIILQVTINSREELDVYQKDEYHCSVVKKHMHAVVQSSVAVDYDI